MREPRYYRWTDYDRSRLPNRFLAELDEAGAGPEDWTPRTGYSIGYPGWGLLYYAIACALDPQSFNLAIETRTNFGASSIVIAQAIRDSGAQGELRTVELDPSCADRAADNLEKSGVGDLVTQFRGNSIEVLPAMIGRDEVVRCAFLAGNHEHDHVVEEFEIVLPSLAPGAIVVLDNTYEIAEPGEDPRVFGALRTIVDRFGGNLVNFPFCSWYTPGIAVWQAEPFPGFGSGGAVPARGGARRRAQGRRRRYGR